VAFLEFLKSHELQRKEDLNMGREEANMQAVSRLTIVPKVRKTARRCRVSDEEFEELYGRLFLPLVSRVSRRFGVSREDARDIVQDAFTIALMKLDISGNPKAWLVRAADYMAVNYRRKMNRRADLLSRWTVLPSSAEG
jgi:DNA-directed RNA polymerase specialized sigma24 family protein